MTNHDRAYAYHDVPLDECPLDGWKRIEIQRFEDIQAVGKAVAGEMKALGYPSKDLFAVELALCEAATNAIKHGHRGDASRTVILGYRVGLTEMFMELTDDGPGFDPHMVPNPLEEANLERPSGRGLFLMRVYMSWICFNKRGNRVTLCKRRSQSSPQPA